MFFLTESWKPQRKAGTKFSAPKFVLSKVTWIKAILWDNFCHILDEVRCPNPDYLDTFIYSGPAPSGQEHELPHSFLLKDMFPKLHSWSLWRKAGKQLFFKSVHCHTSNCPFLSCSPPLSPDPPSVHVFNLICCSLGRMFPGFASLMAEESGGGLGQCLSGVCLAFLVWRWQLRSAMSFWHVDHLGHV